MNHAALVRQTTLHALADGVAVHDEVEAIAPGHAVAGLARAGDVAGALRAIAANDDERAAFARITDKPERAHAVVRALAGVQPPPRAQLRGPLVYFALVFLVEAAGASITGVFVAPVMETLLGQRGAPPSDPALTAVAAIALCAGLACVIGAFLARSAGAAGLSRARLLAVDAVVAGAPAQAAESAAVATAARARVERLGLAVRLGGTILVVAIAFFLVLATYAPLAMLGGVP